TTPGASATCLSSSRASGGAAPRRRETASVSVPVPLAPGAAVRAEPAAIALVADHAVVELGRVLDLVLRPVDEDLFVIVVDAHDHTGGKHDLLAEDPRAGVDDEVRRADLVARL